MKGRLFFVFIFLYLASIFPAEAQFTANKRPKFSVGGGIKVPYMITNEAHRKAFRGIFAVGLTYNYEINSRIRVGGFTDYHYYQSFLPRSIYYEMQLRNLMLHLGAAGLHFAYDFPIAKSDRWVFTPEVKIGYAAGMYTNLNNGLQDSTQKTDRKYNLKHGITASAGLNVYLYTNEFKKTAVGLYLGYTYTGYEFKKSDANITNNNSGEFYFIKDNGPTMGIQFGFSFMFKVGGDTKGRKSEYDFEED